MFDRLYGNKKFKSQLLELISGGKLPQSIIIEGENGLGKHVAAALVAAACVCEEKGSPCGECKNCRLALSYSHPDIKVYSPEKNTFKVDTARSIRSNAYLKPLTAKANVAILEHCELMNDEAQNALLKVLEEPPQSAVFILLTENSASFLTTIISRCLILRLSSVSHDEVYDYLLRSGIDEERAYSSAALSDGNIGRALTLAGDLGTDELKVIADDIYKAFCDNDGILMIKSVYLAEKSASAENVLFLVKDKVFSELKAKTESGKRFNKAALVAATDALSAAIESLSKNANKQLTMTILANKLINAASI